MFGTFCLVIGLASLTAAATFAQPPAGAAFLNPDLAPDTRAADLVSRLTLEEKVLQMQSTAPAIPRLGVPAYNWWNEALHGVAQGRATVFPQAIGLAATWNVELMKRVADAISTEARAKYHDAQTRPAPSGPDAVATLPGRTAGLTYWSPNINIFRDPRWGRGQETYGEDPYLTARMGVAFVVGMQGGDPRYLKVVATPKHYAVHSGPEPARHTFDARVSEADLVDTYLPAFRATVVEGRAGSVMCVYNAVNGMPGCASTDLLQKRLRDAWGFRGCVVSDCGAVSDIYRNHKFTPTMGGAAVVRGQSRYRSHLRDRVPDTDRRGEGRHDLRSRDRSCPHSPVRRACPAGDVRSAGAGAVLEDPDLGQRLSGASEARQGRGQGSDRPAEERAGTAAVGDVGSPDRRHRTFG